MLREETGQRDDGDAGGVPVDVCGVRGFCDENEMGALQ